MPMWLGSGPEPAMVYNEANAGILQDKHPQALGTPLVEVWSEIWPDIAALIDTALSGQGLYREDLPLSVRRRGRQEPAWFSFSYSPLRDLDGAVRGAICSVWETTAKVQALQDLVRSEAQSQLRQAQENETEDRYRLAVLATLFGH